MLSYIAGVSGRDAWAMVVPGAGVEGICSPAAVLPRHGGSVLPKLG